MELEREELLTVSAAAAGVGFDNHTCQLARAVVSFLNDRCNWRAIVDLPARAVASAEIIGDPSVRAKPHTDAATSRWRIGDHDPALAHLAQARALWLAIDGYAGLANVERLLAHISEERGDTAGAIEHAEKAVDFSRTTVDIGDEARSVESVAWFYAQANQHQQGLSHAGRALELRRLEGDLVGEAHALDTMGLANHRLGCHSEAIAYYDQTASRYRVETGGLYYCIQSLMRAAEVYQDIGDDGQVRAII